MGEGITLVNLGELSKPATVLIEKISEGVGGWFLPYQIRRVAKADADAMLTKAAAEAVAVRIESQSEIEVTDLKQRALRRFVAEEAIKQANMESITNDAVPLIEEDAKAEEMDNDWIGHFFDKCRLISDKEMQKLWSAVLAGEANSPGAYSKRTVSILSSLDKSDASLFETLCSFCCDMNAPIPLVFDYEMPVYSDAGLTFAAIDHLNSIGLISFMQTGYVEDLKEQERVEVRYHGASTIVEYPDPLSTEIRVGQVTLTRVGEELASVCTTAPREGFFAFVKVCWRQFGYVVDGEKDGEPPEEQDA